MKTRILKWIIIPLIFSGWTFILLSCSKDDNDGPAFSKDGKKLVSKIEANLKNDDGADWKETATFKYNNNGELIRLEVYADYLDGDWEKEVYNYKRSGNEMKITGSYTKYYDREKEEAKISLTATLDEEGQIVKIEGYDGYDEWSETYSYSDGYLVMANGQEVIWEGGNIVSSQGNFFSYGKYENKTNLEFIAILESVFGELGLEMTGYTGKVSKNLPETGNGTKYEYTLDKKGDVSEIKISYTYDEQYLGIYKIHYN